MNKFLVGGTPAGPKRKNRDQREMTKKNTKSVNVDRSIWMSTLELMKEFGYQDRGSVSNLCTVNNISKMRNPESPLPQSLLYNKQEFTAIPAVARRLVEAPEMEKFDKELHLKGDWMIAADWHIPYHDAELVEKMIMVAEKFGIKKLVKPGDFMELDAFKIYLDKTASWEYEKTKSRNVLKSLLSYFDEDVWLIGNHEVRMWKRLQGMGDEEDIFQMVLDAELIRKVKYSTYPYAVINESWLVVHPKSYSRVQARNAYFLASKYLPRLVERGKSPNGKYGIVAFHGHLGGFGTDVSGRFEVADGMCMVDSDKVAYKKIKVDTSPEWRPGFFMLLDNYLYPFPKDSINWDFWEKRISYV